MNNRRQPTAPPRFPEPPTSNNVVARTSSSSRTTNNSANHQRNKNDQSDCVVVSVATSQLDDQTTVPSSYYSSNNNNNYSTAAESQMLKRKAGSDDGLNNHNNYNNSAISDEKGTNGPDGADNQTTALTTPSSASVLSVVYSRLSVLVSLLLLQSMSQFVLEYFENVVQANIVIPLFLTMLVGAGGNAGNQSAVRAIAMLARGELSKTSKLRQILPFVKRECVIGFICALVLSTIGALRVFVHQVVRRGGFSSGSDDDGNGNNNDVPATTTAAAASLSPSSSSISAIGDQASIGVIVLAITLSLFLIVALSAMIGVILPFAFLRAGLSPEHAAPAIQVIMDVLGVFLTCVVCSAMLPSANNIPQPPQPQQNVAGAGGGT